MTTQTWYGAVTELRPIEDTRGRLFEILRFAPGAEHGQAYISTCRHGIV